MLAGLTLGLLAAEPAIWIAVFAFMATSNPPHSRLHSAHEVARGGLGPGACLLPILRTLVASMHLGADPGKIHRTIITGRMGRRFTWCSEGEGHMGHWDGKIIPVKTPGTAIYIRPRMQASKRRGSSKSSHAPCRPSLGGPDEWFD